MRKITRSTARFFVFAFGAMTLACATQASGHGGGGKYESEKWEIYKERYQLPDVYTKLVNNHGDGSELVYGTRNFRMLLPGIQYRGGANNVFHRKNVRENENPLPDDGLMNLCEEGFSNAIYLYTKNFSTAPAQVNCTNRLNGNTNQLNYLQISPFSEVGINKVMKIIHETITTDALGPVYTHCWNGWHASGLVSAVALRQFCSWSTEDAVAYWDRNTDGVNKDPNYEKSRERIRKYVISAELKISKDIAAQVCP